MNGKELLRELGGVDESFLTDAMTEVPSRKHHWWKCAVAAACLFLAAGVGLWWAQRPYVIRLDQVAVTPLADVQPVEPIYDPAVVTPIAWEDEQATEYYGRDLTPAYIPENLKVVEHNALVLVESDGTVVRDVMEFSYCDTAPSESHWLEAEAFSMMVSTDQLLVTCVLDPTAPHQITEIGGVEVSLGTVFQDNAIPCYVAEFGLHDLQYYLEFRQMELAEVVKVVASIIYDSDNVLIK